MPLQLRFWCFHVYAHCDQHSHVIHSCQKRGKKKKDLHAVITRKVVTTIAEAIIRTGTKICQNAPDNGAFYFFSFKQSVEWKDSKKAEINCCSRQGEIKGNLMGLVYSRSER